MRKTVGRTLRERFGVNGRQGVVGLGLGLQPRGDSLARFAGQLVDSSKIEDSARGEMRLLRGGANLAT